MTRSSPAALLASVALALHAGGTATPRLVPPVDAPIARAFEAPATDYGRGHRGVDYRTAASIAVRAAAPGRVEFAGRVAGAYAVTVVHAGGLDTTYSRLGAVVVARGMRVTTGTWLGSAGEPHPEGGPGLHFGVRLDGVYVDPARFMVAVDAGRAIHLTTLQGPTARSCGTAPLNAASAAPNDNVAVVIPGLASETATPGRLAGYRSWSTRLGYAARDSFVFSYRGPRGPELHAPYLAADTFGSLRGAAARLRALLARIARVRPGRDVDLIAHSQGGVVARLLAESVSPGTALPRIEHLVTLAAPHSGAPLAGVAAALAAGSHVRAVLAALAPRGWLPVGDPAASSVHDLAPGSSLQPTLARQDVAYGTRVLALGMPHDLVVPADRTGVPNETGRIVPPDALWGHGGIVRSGRVRRLTYDFLRDARDPCRTMWDFAGPALGRLVGAGEGLAGATLGRALGSRP